MRIIQCIYIIVSCIYYTYLRFIFHCHRRSMFLYSQRIKYHWFISWKDTSQKNIFWCYWKRVWKQNLTTNYIPNDLYFKLNIYDFRLQKLNFRLIILMNKMFIFWIFRFIAHFAIYVVSKSSRWKHKNYWYFQTAQFELSIEYDSFITGLVYIGSVFALFILEWKVRWELIEFWVFYPMKPFNL